MKKLFLLLTLLCVQKLCAQDLDDRIISEVRLPLKEIKTHKIIGYIQKGDTIELINIRIKPYYFVRSKNKEGIVLESLLKESKNFQAATAQIQKQNLLYDSYVKKYGWKYAIKVLTGEVTIGMTPTMLVDIKGRKPDKINRTTYSFGVLEQWVYEGWKSNSEYYYFENNKLKSWQEQL
jgi:hypothetical protein